MRTKAKHLIQAGVLVAAVGLLPAMGTAQQLFRRAQYMVNPYLSNPAVAGTTVDSPIYATIRNQWAGFEGAPRTQVLSGYTSLPGRLGIGGMVFNDNTGGAIRQTGVEASAAYAIDLNNYDAVSFGLGLMANQWSFDPTGLEVWDVDDPTLQGAEQKTVIDAHVGMMVFGSNYSFGFSVPQLFQASTGLATSTAVNAVTDNALTRHMQFMGSYSYNVNRQFALEGSGFVRLTGETPAQFDGYLRGVVNKMGWMCMGFRLGESVVLGAGGKLGNAELAYTYEVGVGNVRYFSPHTHELTLGYRFQPARGFIGGGNSSRVFDRRRIVKIAN
jgi:type IX secretion system PorP/SprF family membrane protein